ncbi:MAG: alkaline phosphatase [Candidatus Melainabacteria bacterium RIFOXYA12_FULL_32_12]|nr:MAG: alkaline phosphatase [Candidatus Melainabacteria bacterium GWF2_32_7]OGI18190.1 MAG: alkaline phosphatase [Candidatus Melainabacteria bacterium RIFOXYA2_FULL_32_9]OGI30092.1 MAG: alkaline phosphatase [Candidatus Melainabacteria bacterium RIFOXYA12_FULL_32_12]
MSALDTILVPIIHYIETTISNLGPFGVVILMAIESANIPLPSEAILPFAGYLVSKGIMNFHVACFAGAFGCVVGSVPSYYLGYFGGRPFVEKYGKWFLISKRDLEIADRWTEKYGDISFFICRMLPVVRTFISLPAGILRAHFPRFIAYTFIGSLIWSYFLVYVGVKLGEHREQLKDLWHKFDYAIVGILLVLFAIYVYRHIKHLKES